MKKNMAFFGIMAMVLGITSGMAAAPTSYVTTKGYVDTGLKALYNKIQTDIGVTANEVQHDVDELTIYVGGASTESAEATGLTLQVENLENAVGHASDENVEATGLNARIENLEKTVGADGQNMVYTGTRGITVSENRVVSVNGLSAGSATDGKIYVFQNNVAREMPMVELWEEDSGE